MKFITKLNPSVKMVILIVYAFILLALSIFLVNIETIDETEGYGTTARDENIQLVAKIVESRTAGSLKKDNSKESSNWTITLQITKNNPNVEVTNIESFVKAVAEDDSVIYFEESKNSSGYKGTPSTTSTSFVSYSSGIKRSNSYSSSTKEYTKTNTELKLVFIRTLYKAIDEDGNVSDKELKYYFAPVKPERQDFSLFSKTIELDNSDDEQIVAKDELSNYFTLDVKETINENKTTADNTYSDKFTPHVTANEEKIKEENKYVANASVTVFAKVKNDKTDLENYFPDYVTAIDLHGVFVDQANTSAWTTAQIRNLSNFYKSNCSINTLYETSELYIVLTLTTNDGQTQYSYITAKIGR